MQARQKPLKWTAMAILALILVPFAAITLMVAAVVWIPLAIALGIAVLVYLIGSTLTRRPILR